MPTEIIQLCNATLFCMKRATLLAVFNDGKTSASRPLPCCDDHKALCEEKAAHHRVTVTFKPIAASATQATAA